MKKSLSQIKKILWGWCILLLGNIYAQEINYHNFNVQNGLTSDEVFDLFQDDQKNIWIATSRGVVKYNGEEFFHYTTQDGLGGNVVLYLVQDTTKRIWFLPTNGILSYYFNNRIFQYPYNDSIKAHLKNRTFIRSLALSDKGLYFGTNAAGLFNIDLQGKVTDITDTISSPGKTFGLYQVETKYLSFIYSRVLDQGYHSISIVTGKQRLTHHIENTKGMQNIFFVKRKNGDVLISVFNQLYHFHSDAFFAEYRYSKDIISIYEDADSNVWIGCKGTGVKYFSRSSDFAEKNCNASYFNHLSISKTLLDKDGNYWFASLEKGIFYIPEMNIKTIVDNTYKTEGFYITEFGFINNLLYVGTNNGIVYVHKEDGLQEIGPFGKFPLGVVTNFLDLETGPFVAGTIAGTFMTGKNKGKKRLGSLNAACYDNHGNFFGCFNRSVFKINPTGDTLTIPNATGSRFEAIFCDSKNRIWLGGNIGLFQIVNNEIVSVNLPNAHFHITDLKESNGSLIIATLGNGVLAITEKEIRSYSTSNGLLSDMVNTIIIEDNTYVWAGTTKGLCKINLLKNRVESIIDHRKGLPSDEIKMLALHNDTLFIGNNSYLSFFNTGILHPNDKDPQISIKNIKVNETNIKSDKKYHFAFDENNFEFTIHSYLYRELGHIEYKYRLKGISNQYTYTTNNVIRFMFLPPGEYTFEAYALNEDRKESRIPVLYHFTIHQAYWKTTWFYVLSFSVLLTIIGAVIYSYFRSQEKKRNLQLQLLESKQRAFTNQMNPHFIFNALNSVQTYILAENKTDALNYLGKFSKLMRQTLTNTREVLVPLSSEIELLTHYLELEHSRYRGIEFEIDADSIPTSSPILIPSMLIQPFIENSIKHGILKKFDKEGMIRIHFFTKEKLLYCIIDDDGVGLNEAIKMRNNSHDHFSAGIEITLDRLKLYCKTYNTPYHFEIINKAETGSNESGTRVKFIIPYTLKHETHSDHH